MAKKKKEKRPTLKLVSAPVQRELTPRESKRIEAIWTALGKMTGAETMEDFELGFMRDCNPSEEIRIWEGIMVCCLLVQARAYTKMDQTVAQNVVNFFIGKTAGIHLAKLLPEEVLEVAEQVWDELHHTRKPMSELIKEIQQATYGQKEKDNQTDLPASPGRLPERDVEDREEGS